MGIREIEYYLLSALTIILTYHSENGRKEYVKYENRRKEYVKYKQLAEQKGITRNKLLYIQSREEG